MASSLSYLIHLAVLVLVALRSHVLLVILGPSCVVAIVVVGAVGVQRRLQVGQQRIYNDNKETDNHQTWQLRPPLHIDIR